MWRYLKTNNPDSPEENNDEDLELRTKFSETDKERSIKKMSLYNEAEQPSENKGHLVMKLKPCFRGSSKAFVPLALLSHSVVMVGM
ncbi:hypothetical protein TNCT_492821 [Trichonephila clavata]|uniref:Uncharacterized protein n=1 Tax=Trichonephila clavata TaxID=2740835 RepID=A0A8X6LWL9_TRICU|nr:hypothetical protein TNCT_492821 [Trichonephila clavata]